MVNNYLRFSWKTAAGRLGAIIFGLGMGILLLEILLRMAYPVLPTLVQQPLRYVHKTPFTDETILPRPASIPVSTYQQVARNNLTDQLEYPYPRLSFHITTRNWLDPNSHVGFRVPAPDWQPTWPTDAVFVGDSFTFCFTEYEDCWVHKLETEHQFNAVNLGQGGTGSISHLNILLAFGLAYEPRFVVWQWYGNDFNEDYGFEIGGKTDSETTDTLSDTKLAEWIRANSAVFWMVRSFFPNATAQADFQIHSDPYRTTTDTLDLAYGREYIIESGDMARRSNQEGLQLTQQAILDAKMVLAERNVPLLIFVVPFKEEVYAHAIAEQMGEDKIKGLGEGREALMAFCLQNDLICYDPTAELVTVAKKGDQLYWAEDTHLNPKGNALLAELLWAWFQQEGLAE